MVAGVRKRLKGKKLWLQRPVSADFELRMEDGYSMTANPSTMEQSRSPTRGLCHGRLHQTIGRHRSRVTESKDRAGKINKPGCLQLLSEFFEHSPANLVWRTSRPPRSYKRLQVGRLVGQPSVRTRKTSPQRSPCDLFIQTIRPQPLLC